MTSLRRFRCAACGHEFAVPYGTGQRGRKMTCPACGQAFVHRVDTGGRGRGARGPAFVSEPAGASGGGTEKGERHAGRSGAEVSLQGHPPV